MYMYVFTNARIANISNTLHTLYTIQTEQTCAESMELAFDITAVIHKAKGDDPNADMAEILGKNYRPEYW